MSKQDELAARQERHKQGYPPQPPSLPMKTWAPKFTEKQQKEHDEYVASNKLPF